MRPLKTVPKPRRKVTNSQHPRSEHVGEDNCKYRVGTWAQGITRGYVVQVYVGHQWLNHSNVFADYADAESYMKDL